MTARRRDIRVAPGVSVDRGITEWWTKFLDAQVSHDWETLRSLLSTDARFSSHQSGLRVELSTNDEYVEYARAIYNREHDWEIEILATRGERCVVRLRAFGPGDETSGPWEVERIGLVQIVNGVSPGAEIYDVDDLPLALVRLDEQGRERGSGGE